MIEDRYESFAQLAAQEVEGTDYRISAFARREDVLILAPHGGYIEPSTSAVASAIAGEDLSLYLFEGLREERRHRELHITSRNFDEPGALALAAKADRIVSVHGRRNRDDPEAVWLGGLDLENRDRIQAQLERAGFEARNPGRLFSALDPRNICNRGRRDQGVQMEMPRGLRDLLIRDLMRMAAFAEAIRSAIV
ncbi:poly-gamma-glutamate hydrolase family protein [Sphingobium nicotianae]|uniref:Poly-gamma-glutamate hydrolase family protein n=1 Tax=Sphingobium nicotianae TaxID=2782607 RepID=A0A9X1ITD2_9SPHN|nr:poly-gamma-glutamate hydrolase family protein [Sphingobium nicotianae]MBT2189225.1 poly-gamma-glutamate hydrolase family protein [Sphingobium nicotianae]